MSANTGYSLIWATVLVLCFFGVYSLLVWDVATVGSRANNPLLTLAASSILLLTGLFAHWALGHVRGIASGLWPGLIFPAVFAAFHFASLGALASGWYNDRLFGFAWNLSVACLLAWAVGYMATRGSLRFHAQPRARWGQRLLGQRELHRLATLGALAFALGFGLQISVDFALGVRSFGTIQYNEFNTAMYSSGGLAAVRMFGQMSCVVGVTVTCCASGLGHRRVFFARWVGAIVSVYLLTLFLQGNRSEMCVVVFPILIARHYFVRPFALQRVVLLGVFMAMAFAGTKMYRATGELSDFASSATDMDMVVSKLSNETGTTLDTVVRSVELVPERFDYHYGGTYGHALSRVLPNVITGRTQAGFVSSLWLTQETTRRKSMAKGGLGFSIVAEAYINFGPIGAPFVLMLIGLLHGRAERWLAGHTVDVRLVSLFCVLEVALFVHVRNSAILYVRGGIWMGTMLAVLFGVNRFIRRANRR